MIIPSKEVVLITAAQSKQLFMFDAKTGCILHKYTTQSVLASSAAYYQHAQQLVLPHLNNTYVNIWDADTQEPKKFSVGQGEKINCVQIFQHTFMMMGSANGNLYIFELPTGVNIRRVAIHSNPIIKLHLLNNGYLISCTANQLKLWAFSEFINEKKTPVPQKTIHSTAPIIDFAYSRQIICLATQNSIKLYHSSNLQAYDRQFPCLQRLSNISCICSTRTGFYIGTAHGKISMINLDQNQRQFSYSNNSQQIQIKKFNTEVDIDAKDPLTSLVYVESLRMLISGNCKGQIKIWENKKLKNSMHLFKSSISHLFTYPKPNKSIKIPHSAKIKALHKQQLTKLENPIIVYSQPPRSQPKKSQHDYFLDMIDCLSDPKQLLLSQIQILKQQNSDLIKANLHYQSQLQSLLDD